MLLYYNTRRQCIVCLSSLLVLTKRNLFEWGQLFSREVLWCVGNFPGGGQFSSLAIIRGEIFLGGNCPGTFLMVTHLFLFIHDVLYAHIMYILLKNVMCCTKNYVVQQKNISHKSYQNYVSHKKIYCSNKKIYVTSKERLVLTK